MSKFLNKDQQQQFDKILDELRESQRPEQEGIRIKVGSKIVYREKEPGQPDVDAIKPQELEKLDAALENSDKAKGAVTISFIKPAEEEVYKFKDGELEIDKRRYVPEQDQDEEPTLNPDQAQQAAEEDLAANQRPQTELDEEKDPGQKALPPSKSPQMGAEWGYVQASYFLEGADKVFGEGYQSMTPAGLVAAAEMGVDIWRLGRGQETEVVQGEIVDPPALQGTPERAALPSAVEGQTQLSPEQRIEQLTSRLDRMAQQMGQMQQQLEEMRSQQTERVEQTPEPKENKLGDWFRDFKQGFTDKAQEFKDQIAQRGQQFGDFVREGIDSLKDRAREAVGQGLETATKWAVSAFGKDQGDGSKQLGNFRAEGDRLEVGSARQRLEEMRQAPQQPQEIGSARQRLNELLRQQAETDNQNRTRDMDVDR